MPENSNTEQKYEAFIMLPKKLLTDERYSSLSPISVMIYSALADRVSLSQKNGWIDDDGRVFIYFAINEMAKLVGCGKDRVFNSYKQLEKYGITFGKPLSTEACMVVFGKITQKFLFGAKNEKIYLKQRQ